MRVLVFLSILGVAASESRLAQQGFCAVDGAESVSDLMDSSMFLWAAVSRCGKKGEQVKCEVDVSSAIESIFSMVNTIVKAVNQCGDIKTHAPKCGLAASAFGQHSAGLAAASGEIALKCGKANHTVAANNWVYAKEAQCIVNVKDTAKSLFKVIKAFLKVKSNCNDANSRACAGNSLQIVSALASMGEYLAGTMGECAKAGATRTEECAEGVNSLVSHFSRVAQDAIAMSKQCEADLVLVIPIEVQTARLYDDEKKKHHDDERESKKHKEDDKFVANLALGAFLPVTAFASFVVGKVFGDRRVRMTETREFMSDHE